jgi:hypothetical protein
MTLTYNEARNERRNLKQRLWKIRLFVEKEVRYLEPELRELKAKYEALPNFTSWSGFPEEWDIGDPNKVKSKLKPTSKTEAENFNRISGKSYETIVKLDTQEKSPQEVAVMAQLEAQALLNIERKRISQEKKNNLHIQGTEILLPPTEIETQASQKYKFEEVSDLYLLED